MKQDKIRVGDMFTTNGFTFKVIGLKPGGKVELFDKENTRFTDRWHKDVIKWQRISPCPECNGTGVLSGFAYTTGCCGLANSDGSCCGVPVPEPYPMEEQCGNCHATGSIKIRS